jgi:hypothetical protein
MAKKNRPIIKIENEDVVPCSEYYSYQRLMPGDEEPGEKKRRTKSNRKGQVGTRGMMS